MLYLVYFGLTLPKSFYRDLYQKLPYLGPKERIYENCYLLASQMSVTALRRTLYRYLATSDMLVVCTMAPGQCAGKLPPYLKHFVEQHIQA